MDTVITKPSAPAERQSSDAGWRLANNTPSLQSVTVPKHFSFWRKMLAFSGPGYLVAGHDLAQVCRSTR